jgi:uncharacterized protein (DUF983 family)
LSADPSKRRVWRGFCRGLLGRCPQCGDAKLFSSYLKLIVKCPSCAHALDRYRADDGPAYFTILIVGHIFLAPLLFANFIRTWPTELVWAIVIPGIIGFSLWLLPRVKGAFVGVQWAIGDRGGN